ncbi:MAG: histidinol-phosphatase [Candidatus Zixiibacteriota bacterium]
MTDFPYHIATGAIHVHTTDSDGTKTHEEVAAIAGEAGLDFVMFSDHMTLQSYYDGKEGYYGKVLVIIGYEHNDLDDNNHYLIFDGDEVFPASMKAAEYVKATADKGMLGIMAHPDEIRGRDARFRSYPWTDWSVTEFDGIEIWNQMSEWMENLKYYNQIRMLFSPRKFLRAPTDRILRKWDELSQKRPVVGIVSVDAHGFLYKAGPLKLTIFPYKVQFKTLRSHLMLTEPLSKDVATARKQVFEAIRKCRVFGSNYRWGEAKDFRFSIESNNDIAYIGGEVSFGPQTTARVSAPLKGKIRLIGNGKIVAEKNSQKLDLAIDSPGVYRVEIYHGRKGWIFSNHIRVGADA